MGLLLAVRFVGAVMTAARALFALVCRYAGAVNECGSIDGYRKGSAFVS